jgi:hypothetical protein
LAHCAPVLDFGEIQIDRAQRAILLPVFEACHWSQVTRHSPCLPRRAVEQAGQRDGGRVIRGQRSED